MVVVAPATAVAGAATTTRCPQPGCTALAKNTGAFGKNSYQPWYVAVPLAQSASVPVCSTVGVPSPSRPTQKEEKVLAAP